MAEGQISFDPSLLSVVTDPNGQPLIGRNASTGMETLTIYNIADQSIFEIENTDSARKLFNLLPPKEPADVNDASLERTVDNLEKTKTTRNEKTKTSTAAAVWRDDNAVRKLIALRDEYKPLFNSKTVKKAEIWNMISAELTATNPLWVYTGVQCENKYKDGRKLYNAVKDNQFNGSGNETRSCNFFKEYQAVLGDKPGVKPVSTASSMRRPAAEVVAVARDHDIEDPSASEGGQSDASSAGTSTSSSASATTSSTSSSDGDSTKHKKRKKIEEQLAEFSEALQEDKNERERRHQENLQRMDLARETYKEMMSKLIDKL